MPEGAVNTTYTFASTDVITSTKLNDILDQSVMTGTAIIGNTLEVASGKLKVASQGITSNEMGDGSVKTIAIADGAVTTAKIANSTGAADGVTTAKLAIGAVTTAKITDANVTTAKIADANITAPKLSGAQTGTAPVFGIRAWVNFDAQRNASGGSDTANTDRYLYASGNVTSVMKNATGDFTITFTTALPSVNYGAVITTTDKLVGTGVVPKIYAESINDVAALMTTTQLRIATNAYNPRSVSVFVTG